MTNRVFKRYITVVTFLLAGIFGPVQHLRAQEPQLTLKAPSSVTVNQPFEVSYAINVRGSKNFQAPAFKGLDVLYGPSQSQSSSFSFVNGHQSQTFTLSYTYRLRAPQAGTLNFGKASIEVDGKTYYSEPFSITVNAAPAAQPGGSGSGGSGAGNSAPARSQSSQQSQSSNGQISDNDLFIQAVPNKRSPYVGEQVILSYRIYTAIPVEQYSIYKTPSNKGFWTEELKIDLQSQQQEVVNNKSYIYADIRKVALFAQEAGKLQLDPMEVEAVAQVRTQRQRRSRSIFDFFEDDFFAPVELVKKSLYTKPITVNVKPLPQEGKPLSFDGLVGDYTVSLDYDKTQNFKTNEAITFTFTVSGKGNIEMINAPVIQFPPDFEVYEPKISHNKNITSNGVSGSATFEYIVVPRSPGAYKIPSFDYSFFNPATARYTEKNIPEIVLNIAPGKDMPAVANASDSRASGSDIAYIQTGVPKWKKVGHRFIFSLWFWLCLLAEAVLFCLAVLLLKRNRKIQSDLAGLKNRKAAKEAKKCLRKAEKFLKDRKRDAFHIEISQALWGFLGNKLNIPTASLSMDNIRTELEKRALPEELISRFVQTLDHCEFARFAPKEPDDKDMQRLYNEALETVYSMVGALR